MSFKRGEEGQPQLFLVRATSKSSSYQKYFFSVSIFNPWRQEYFFKNLSTIGNRWDIKFSLTNLKFEKILICSENDVLQISISLQELFYASKQLFLFLNFIFTHISSMISVLFEFIGLQLLQFLLFKTISFSVSSLWNYLY